MKQVWVIWNESLRKETAYKVMGGGERMAAQF